MAFRPRYVLPTLCAIALAVAALWRLTSLQESSPPDLLFYNGTILTMEAGPDSTASALLVQAGRVAATGTRTELEQLIEGRTEQVDLQGRTLLPGFIEPHTHVDLSAFLNPLLDLSPFSNQSTAQIWQKLQQQIDQTPPGEWILAKGLDPDLMMDLQPPSRTELDAMAPDNPVFIMSQTLHSAWVNSLALEAVGLTSDSPDPSDESYYGRDEQGELTGYVHEIEALKVFNEVIADSFDIVANTRLVLDQFLADGITAVATTGVFGVDKGALTLFDYFSTHSPSLLHRAAEFSGVLPRRHPTVRHFVYLLDEDQAHLPDSVENGDDFFRVLGVKFWYDGSVLAMTEGHSGRTYNRAEFVDKARSVHEAGWQIAIHANDTWAIEEAVGVLDDVIPASSANPVRHRLEHATRLPTRLMPDIARLGMTAGFQLNMLHYYGDLLASRMPAEDLASIYPVGSASDAGIISTLHSDAPAFPQAPLHLVAMAATRTTRSGAVVGASESLPVPEGLLAITRNAAIQLGMEDRIGSLGIGMYADMVIVDRNPLETPPQHLNDIRVLATYVNGRKLYESP